MNDRTEQFTAAWGILLVSYIFLILMLTEPPTLLFASRGKPRPTQDAYESAISIRPVQADGVVQFEFEKEEHTEEQNHVSFYPQLDYSFGTAGTATPSPSAPPEGTA
jgi:hypothetical protein